LRPLTFVEAFRIADLQAAKFLKMVGLELPPVPEEAIAALPRLEVRRISPFAASGASHWTKGRWQILVNGAEAPVRQRFTIAHEFKHVLDHPFIGSAYPDLPGHRGHDRAEQICDYFAGCVLMPKPWVQSAYYDRGIQRLELLARRFKVSQMAMRVRLLQLGIVQPQARCLPYQRESADSLALTPVLVPEGLAA
jgi:Zn-dependent peptidase ImmA (M78 family)